MTTEVLRNMLYAGSRTLAEPRLRGDGRGALPRRPDARRRLGGGDHPPARVGGAGLAVGHREQRRGVRRVARHRARRDHHDRRGAATGAALPARDRRPADVRPVRRRGRRPLRDRGPRAQGQPGAASGWRATTGRAAGSRTDVPPAAASGPNKGPGGTRGVWTPSRSEVVEQLDRAGLLPGDRVHLQPGRLRRRGPAVPEQQPAADHAGGARPDLRVRRGALLEPARRGPAGARLPRVPRRPDPRHRRAPRRHAADLQGVRRGAVPARPVPGRVRDRDAGARASTCPRARW